MLGLIIAYCGEEREEKQHMPCLGKMAKYGKLPIGFLLGYRGRERGNDQVTLVSLLREPAWCRKKSSGSRFY